MRRALATAVATAALVLGASAPAFAEAASTGKPVQAVDSECFTLPEEHLTVCYSDVVTAHVVYTPKGGVIYWSARTSTVSSTYPVGTSTRTEFSREQGVTQQGRTIQFHVAARGSSADAGGSTCSWTMFFLVANGDVRVDHRTTQCSAP